MGKFTEREFLRKGGDLMSIVEVMEDFAQNLRLQLRLRGMTQKDLADETWLSTSLISYYVNAERMPTFKNLVNISLVLGCRLEDLIVTDQYID